MKQNRRWFEILVFVLLILISILIFIFRASFEKLGEYGYVGVFVLCLLANGTVLLPAPSLMVVVSSAQSLNPFWVATAGACGATLGELSGYWFGRTGNRLFTSFTGVVQWLSDKIRNDYVFTFVLAVLPFPVFDAAGIYAGGKQISMWKFQGVCLLGKWIKMLFYAFVFSNLQVWLPRFISWIINL